MSKGPRQDSEPAGRILQLQALSVDAVGRDIVAVVRWPCALGRVQLVAAAAVGPRARAISDHPLGIPHWRHPWYPRSKVARDLLPTVHCAAARRSERKRESMGWGWVWFTAQHEELRNVCSHAPTAGQPAGRAI